MPRDADEATRLALGVRRRLAHMAVTSRRRKTLNMLFEAVTTCVEPGVDCFLEGTPIDVLHRRGLVPARYAESSEAQRKELRRMFAVLVADSNVWASFIEVELAHSWLKKHGVALLVFPSSSSIRSAVDWRAALRVMPSCVTHVLVLITDGTHYMYVSTDGHTLPTVAGMQCAFACEQPGGRPVPPLATNVAKSVISHVVG